MALIDRLPSIAGAAADVHAPAANTAAVLTYVAVADKRHFVSQVTWSYNAAPTNGNLKVEDVSGTTIFSMDITAAGPGQINFYPPLKSAALNTALIITLAAGGASVTGKVNARHWTET